MHTTPPADGEKAPRCSRSPQLTHDAELRRDSGDEQQLEPERERVARDRACAAGSPASNVSSLASSANTSGWASSVSNSRATASQARAAQSSAAALSRSAGARFDRVGAGDRVELAPPWVQGQAHLEERLEPRAEAAAGAPRALGDRRHAAPVDRVEMHDAIRLAVADRAQDDRIGLKGQRHAVLFEAMKSVTVYTTDMCPFCVGAKKLLDRRGIPFEEINLARDPDARAKLVAVTGRSPSRRS